MTLSDALANLGFKVWTKGKNVGKGSVNIQCPFCDDRSNHLSFQLKTGYYKCWRCSSHGSLWRFLRTINANTDIIREIQFDELVQKEHSPPAAIKWLKDFVPYLQTSHQQYLSKRRFDPNYLQKKYALMSSKHYGKFKFRVIIPMMVNNRVVNFTGRDVTGLSELRYMTCPEEDAIVPRNQIVYNLDSVNGSMIIVEGPTDVWRIGDGCVATLSTQFTPKQISAILQAKPSRVFVMYDAEENAQKQAMDLAFCLSPFIRHVEVVSMDSGDPGDLSDEDVRYLRKELL